MTTTETATTDAGQTTDADTTDVDTETETETDATETDDDDAETDDQADDETAADDAKGDVTIGGEAARYRVRLRAAEAELTTARDAHAATTDVLTRQRQAIVDATLAANGLDARLLAAAAHTVDDFVGEDGLVDRAKLAEAAKAAVVEFGVQPRRSGPRPNRQQGNPGGSSGGGATWGTVLGQAAN